MNEFLRRLALVFSAGAGGGLVNSLVVYAAGLWGLTAMMGVNIAPAISPEWLYPRIVWGGLWGVLFLLPFFKNSWIAQGILFSLAPSAVQLLVVFPEAGYGAWGLSLGTLTPIAVLIFNAIWGLTAANLLKRF